MTTDPPRYAETVAGPWPICRRCDGILLGAVPHDHAAHRIALRAWRQRHNDGLDGAGARHGDHVADTPECWDKCGDPAGGCVCRDGLCGGTGDLDPGEAGYCAACASLDKEDHCLVCPYECCAHNDGSLVDHQGASAGSTVSDPEGATSVNAPGRSTHNDGADDGW